MFCRRKFEEKIKLFFFWEKPDVFIFSRTFGQYFSGYGWKVFDSVVGITIYVSCQRVDEVGFFEPSFTFIELWAKRSLTSFSNFRRDCRNYILPVHKVFPKEICFRMNSFLKSNIGPWVEVTRHFDNSFLEEFLKMPSLFPEETLLKQFSEKCKFLS